MSESGDLIIPNSGYSPLFPPPADPEITMRRRVVSDYSERTMSDTEKLFNFVPMNQPAVQQSPGQKTLGLARKRPKTEQTFFQYCIKKPIMCGRKIIKIEIYDTDSFTKSEQSMCNCEANVCIQHVVKDILFDQIYSSTRLLIATIQDDIEPKP